MPALESGRLVGLPVVASADIPESLGNISGADNLTPVEFEYGTQEKRKKCEFIFRFAERVTSRPIK
jgi:hypothetical protein